MELVDRLLKGDERAVARLITLLENRSSIAREAIRLLYPYTGNAYVIGITGAPGVGKSTLIDRIAREYRKEDKKIGILVIDPNSPFTGGAIFGDRIRMMGLSTDKDVFIRSMGSRSKKGGLAPAIHDAIRVLDAFGKQIILVETMGIGQAEVDIVKVADTAIVVSVPGLGNSIQTIKAGVMEIADIFVVNKADHPFADRVVYEIESMLDLDLSASKEEWRPPVIKTSAEKGEGILDLIKAIENHRTYLHESNRIDYKRRKRIENELIEVIRDMCTENLLKKMEENKIFEKFIDEMVNEKKDPYFIAEKFIREWIRID
ncbi:MAG: methylmalonyl Co-A mutase-associated GTPase MeaB [Candidatus Hydrothermarchaeota archaeon]